jgi:hypothetical protein
MNERKIDQVHGHLSRQCAVVHFQVKTLVVSYRDGRHIEHPKLLLDLTIQLKLSFFLHKRATAFYHFKTTTKITATHMVHVLECDVPWDGVSRD